MLKCCIILLQNIQSENQGIALRKLFSCNISDIWNKILSVFRLLRYGHLTYNKFQSKLLCRKQVVWKCERKVWQKMCQKVWQKSVTKRVMLRWTLAKTSILKCLPCPRIFKPICRYKNLHLNYLLLPHVSMVPTLF